MSPGSALLARPVRLRALASHGAPLALIGSAAGVLPVPVALLAGDWRLALGLGAGSVALALAGLGGRRLVHERELRRNEALVLVALAFVVMSLHTALGYAATGMPWRDALFEAVSGVTTTGLSTLADPRAWSDGLLFTRAWSQWYGGLGVIVFALAIVDNPGVVGRRLYAPVGGELPRHTTRRHARAIVLCYGALTLACWLLVVAAGGAPFDALLHTLAAVSTGGFSPHADSLAALPGWAERYAIMVGTLAGALPVAVVIAVGLRSGGRDVEIRTFALLVAVVGGLLAWRIGAQQGLAWDVAAREGLLLGISAQTTTGFATLSPARLDDAAKLLLCFAMLVGGCLGSTAGGFNVLRVLIVGRVLQGWLQRTALPDDALLADRLGTMTLEQDDVRQVLLLGALFSATLGAGWMGLLACGYPALDALFEAASALATTGLSVGITSAAMPDGAAALLALLMLLGRVELFALLVLVYPRTWHARR